MMGRRLKSKSWKDVVAAVAPPLSVPGVLCVLLYVLTCSLLGLRLRHDLEEGIDQHTLAKHVAALFTCMSVPISAYLIYDHLSHFFQPKLQIQVIRIILIVPVFAFESTLSIYFVDHAFYFQVLREFYESYVIYSFMLFLLYYLGDTEKIVQALVLKPSSFGIHKQPFCCISSWTMGRQFLVGCKTGVLQYVLNRFLLTTLSLVLNAFDMYVEGDYSLDSPFLYLTVINSLSQTYALYALFLFYNASSSEFKSIRPFEKFLSIKLIIFFSWWQGILIGFLVNGAQVENGFDHSSSFNSSTGGLGHEGGFARKINSGLSADQHTTQHIADGIQDLLICMEMLIAAIAFTYSFPVVDFTDSAIIARYDSDVLSRRGIPVYATPSHDDTDSKEWRGAFTSTPSGLPGIRRRGGPVHYDNVEENSPKLAYSSSSEAKETKLKLVEIDSAEHRVKMLAQQGPAGGTKYLQTPVVYRTLTSSLSPFSSSKRHTSDRISINIEECDAVSRSDDSSVSTENARQISAKSERRFLKKSHSTSSIGSLESSESAGLHRQISQPHQNSGSSSHSRKFKWKGASTQSLYGKNNGVNNGIVGVEESNIPAKVTNSLIQNIESIISTIFETCVNKISSLSRFNGINSIFTTSDLSTHELGGYELNTSSNMLRTPKKSSDYNFDRNLSPSINLPQRYTVFQALYLTLKVGNLKSDMLELTWHLIDNIILTPVGQVKRWLLKSNAH